MHTRNVACCFSLLSGWFLAAALCAQTLETKPADPFFEKFQPAKGPAPAGLVLKKGDRVAICGDSITEQKMYSRVMETYLTVCVPELAVTVRQYGWGGETASGFLARMTNDCLRFQPTIATTCYGMNDHGYRAYEESIGARYRQKQTAIVQAFKAHDARVILGSPGCVGVKGPDPKNNDQPPKGWEEEGVEVKNLNLCTLRNICIEIAGQEGVGFADVFWPMLKAGFEARRKYSPTYAIAGGDGVHPGWAGSFVMAYALLKSFGLDGEIGTFTVDLGANKAEVSKGHKLVSFKDGALTVRSRRYPFCAAGPVDRDSSIRSAMTLVPFNQELNRLILVVKNGPAASYKVTWGAESRTYPAGQLAQGVNLAEDFAVNPFSEAFRKVDEAVAAKQAYETKQVKQVFHGPEGKADMDAAVEETEAERAPLAAAIRAALVPVTHMVKIEAE
jgi:hypothetical protein